MRWPKVGGDLPPFTTRSALELIVMSAILIALFSAPAIIQSTAP